MWENKNKIVILTVTWNSGTKTVLTMRTLDSAISSIQAIRDSSVVKSIEIKVERLF